MVMWVFSMLGPCCEPAPREDHRVSCEGQQPDRISFPRDRFEDHGPWSGVPAPCWGPVLVIGQLRGSSPGLGAGGPGAGGPGYAGPLAGSPPSAAFMAASALAVTSGESW